MPLRIDFQRCCGVGGNSMCLPGRVRGACEDLAGVGDDSIANVDERAVRIIEQRKLLVMYGIR